MIFHKNKIHWDNILIFKELISNSQKLQSMEQKYYGHLVQNFSINCQYCTVCILYWSKPLHWLNPVISYSKDPKDEKKNLSIIITFSMIEICKHYNYPPKSNQSFSRDEHFTTDIEEQWHQEENTVDVNQSCHSATLQKPPCCNLGDLGNTGNPLMSLQTPDLYRLEVARLNGGIDHTVCLLLKLLLGIQI